MDIKWRVRWQIDEGRAGLEEQRSGVSREKKGRQSGKRVKRRRGWEELEEEGFNFSSLNEKSKLQFIYDSYSVRDYMKIIGVERLVETYVTFLKK